MHNEVEGYLIPFDREAFEESLRHLAKEMIAHPHNMRESAIKELAGIESPLPDSTFIVVNYPDFEHILLKCKVEGKMEMRLCISPKAILEDEDMLHFASKTFEVWLDDMGGIIDEEADINIYKEIAPCDGLVDNGGDWDAKEG